MQRLVVELSTRDLTRFDVESLAGKFELLEVIHYLRMGTEGFAGICRIKPSPGIKIEEMVVGSNIRFELLAKEGDNFVVYLEIRPITVHCPIFSEVYLSAPPEIRGEMIRLTALGEIEGIRKMMEGMDQAAVRYKVCSLTDAKFPPNSPISTLTDRQRKILLEAYEQGYYEVPRRINSEELANRLKIDKSTVVEHLRKAENRLMSQIVMAR
jgi:DNA-binding CsgD family transcriptional regulator